MKVLLVHPGTQYSFRLAAQLERHKLLARFWTGIAFVRGGGVDRCIQRLPEALHSALGNRRLDAVSAENLRTRPLGEIRAWRRLRSGHPEEQVMLDRNARFQRLIPQREFADNKIVIGFDTSSWILAERTRAAGGTFILDQSIGHRLSFEPLFPMLRRRFPEWSENLAPRLPKLGAAEAHEHCLASRVVTASSFTRRTLLENGVPEEKISIIPYGVDLDAFSPVSRPDPSRPLRFVFVGSISARKGVPLLLEAWRAMAPAEAELWLVGPSSEQQGHLLKGHEGVRVVGKVLHRDLPAVLAQCDVLVFPSYFEGFGLVLLEAMAAGLPVIATDATAAPDLITEGVEGHLFPVGDAQALASAMAKFINSPGILAPMSAAARRRAEQFSWVSYGDRWAELLTQIT